MVALRQGRARVRRSVMAGSTSISIAPFQPQMPRLRLLNVSAGPKLGLQVGSRRAAVSSLRASRLAGRRDLGQCFPKHLDSDAAGCVIPCSAKHHPTPLHSRVASKNHKLPRRRSIRNACVPAIQGNKTKESCLCAHASQDPFPSAVSARRRVSTPSRSRAQTCARPSWRDSA